MRTPLLALAFVACLSVAMDGQDGTTKIPFVPGTAAISGVVVDAVTSRPVAGALVRLQDDVRQRTAPISAGGMTLTDAKGRFVFRNLSARRYGISVTALGYFLGVFGTEEPDTFDLSISRLLPEPRIALTEGQWFSEARIQLWPPASISGSVRDERGDPVVGQYVRALSVDARIDWPALSVLGEATTDDRGAYVIGRLAPGRYVTVVLPFNSDGLDGLAEGSVAYARTFLPNSRGLSGATPITVKAGENLTGVDLTLDGLPARRVSGRVDGPPSAWENLRLVLASPDESFMGSTIWIATAWVNDDGTFDFPHVPDGKYVLMSDSWAHHDRRQLPTDAGHKAVFSPYHARMPLEVGDTDMTNVVVPLRLGGEISGRVVADPGASPGRISTGTPGVYEPWRPAVAPADGTIANGIRAYSSAGSFTLSDLFEREVCLHGDYSVGIKSVLVDGRDMTNRPIDLGGGASYSNVEVRIANLAKLSGVIRSGGGVATRSAFLFFPTERLGCDQARSRSPRLGFVVTPGDGTYAVSIPGGRYYVAGVPDSRRNGWERPEFLDAAARIATVIDIEWGETKTLDLQLQDVVVK